MPRPALSAARALSVVNFVAARPGRSFTLSELVHHLGVNAASLHSVLAVLEGERYVERDPVSKRYRLGSSLTALGAVALYEHPAILRAQQEAERLAERLDLECVAFVPAGDDLLMVAEAGQVDRLVRRPRVGQRLPFMPPIGALVAAYLPDDGVDRWLSRCRLDPDAPEITYYRRVTGAIRQQGYEVGLESPTREQIGLVLAALVDEPRSAQLHDRLLSLVASLAREESLLVDPAPDGRFSVNNVIAPIFDGEGAVLAALTLVGFENDLDADEMGGYVRALTEATTGITLECGGRLPIELVL